MKELFIFFLCFTVATAATAQDYAKFKCFLGGGYASYSGGSYNPGGGFPILTIEPAYRIKDNFAAGLRIEGAIYYHLSISLNGQYYFGHGSLRPFIGVGLGLFEVLEGSSYRGFGYYPRVGFDKGHLSLSFDYNFISPSDQYYSDGITRYFGIRIGYLVGGGLQ